MILHSAASSALAASRACFLLMPTRALQAVSFKVVGRYILADDAVAALAESMYVVAFNTWKRDGGKAPPHRVWGGKLADS